MRYLTLLAAGLIFLAAWPALADTPTLKAGFPLCIREQMLGEMYNAILNKDTAQMDYLFDHGCFMTKAGVKASVIERTGWSATTAHIRMYVMGDSVDAWVSVGALEGLN